MSVINQMLRDLDQRGHTPAASTPAHAVQQGTQRVPETACQQRPPTHRSSPGDALWAGVALLGGLVLWGGWVMGYLALPGQPAQTATTATVAAPGSVPGASAPSLPPSGVERPLVVAENGTNASDLPVSLRLEAQLEHVPTPVSAMPVLPAQVTHPVVVTQPRAASARTPVPSVPQVEPAQSTVRPAVQPQSSASATVAAAASAAPPPATATPDAGQQAQRQSAAARDALAQAQALWHAGNLGAAIDLLREAVQVSLRTSQATSPMDSTQSAMVRELVRMQMGTGHVAEAHALLVQHELRYAGLAELWALRANAAQRLGLHQDSVQAYMQALQTRPNEQRWLLGLAVSLAAMGQTQAASDVVERARVQGPIPREIAEYLRPLGVAVR